MTSGNWDVTKIYGFDGTEIYFQAAKKSPVERQIYAVNLKGKMREIVGSEGVNIARFSKTFKYFININSTVTKPYEYTLYNNKGKQVRVLEDNHELVESLKNTISAKNR